MTKHLAQLNVARLVAPPGDSRVAGFMDNIALINGVGKTMPGFVWIMEGLGDPLAGNTSTALDGDPRFVSNLTVWEDVASLRHFVFNTVHKKFYDRRAEWFEALDRQHFVMWWVEVGHKPSLDEALARLALRQAQGDTDAAFGWGWL